MIPCGEAHPAQLFYLILQAQLQLLQPHLLHLLHLSQIELLAQRIEPPRVEAVFQLQSVN